MRSLYLSFPAASASPPHNTLSDVLNKGYNSIPAACLKSLTKSEPRPQRRHSVSASNRTGSRMVSGMATQSESVELVPTSVPVRVAHELLQAGHHYLDVRTVEEFSAGHVAGAVNVPFMLRHGPGMIKNPNFLEEVLSHFGKDEEIIVGCQLGKRSFMAASDLISAGFTGITDMAGGYAAWVQNGLPTE